MKAWVVISSRKRLKLQFDHFVYNNIANLTENCAYYGYCEEESRQEIDEMRLIQQQFHQKQQGQLPKKRTSYYEQ